MINNRVIVSVILGILLLLAYNGYIVDNTNYEQSIDNDEINDQKVEFDKHDDTANENPEPKISTVPEEKCSMENRVSRIRDECSKLGLGQEESMDDVAGMIFNKKLKSNYYVDDVHKIVFCPMSKTLSTTFRNLLIQSTGKEVHKDVGTPLEEVFSSIGLGMLRNNYTAEEISHRLKTYMKMIVVRHPFDRLLSSYNHRFVVDYQFPSRLRNFANLTQKYFNATMNTNPENKMELEQFLTLVAEEPVDFVDNHWRNFMSFCDPCLIKYDHVIRLETLDDDVQPVLERLSTVADASVLLPNKTLMRDISDKLEYTSRTFKNIDPGIIEGLMKIYGDDFKVFGYTWDRKTGAGCAVKSKDGKCC